MKSVSKWMGRTVFVLAIGLAGPAWADAPVDEAAASALYEKGIALENAGEWAKAEVQFQESLKHHARPRAAAHLGRVQVEQGKFVEGATNMEWFFQEDTEIPLEAKKGARQPLDVAMKNVGILKLSIEPLDAKVFIDGHEIETKRRGWPQYVTPGVSHKIEVKREGFVAKSEAWTVAAGTEKLVKVTLEAVKVEMGDGKGKVVGKGEKYGPNQRWVILGTALSGAFVAVGAGLALGSYVYNERAQDARRNYDKVNYDLDYGKSGDLLTGAAALGGIGIAGGIGTLVYALRKPKSGEPISSKEMGVTLIPSWNGFVLRATW